jgi:hypothetical protein
MIFHLDDLKQPTPVYAQGNATQMMDIVFIPDVDIQNMDVFRDHCHLMIKDGIFADIFNNDMTRSLLRFFNFYINPQKGEAGPYAHQTPPNWSQLTFAESQCPYA